MYGGSIFMLRDRRAIGKSEADACAVKTKKSAFSGALGNIALNVFALVFGFGLRVRFFGFGLRFRLLVFS